jgi:hypothetical protein
MQGQTNIYMRRGVSEIITYLRSQGGSKIPLTLSLKCRILKILHPKGALSSNVLKPKIGENKIKLFGPDFVFQ